jgi:hypothetical protein
MNALEMIEEAMSFLRQTGHDIGLPIVIDTAPEADWHIPIDGRFCNYNDILRLFNQEKVFSQEKAKPAAGA